MALTIPSRTPWEDRFRTPTAAELRGALAPQFHVPFEHARAKLTQIPGASETIRWHGVWKWTFEYACAGEAHGEVFAFLVADPARPRVCISVTDAAMSGMDLRKLAKGVREGLTSAPAVDGIRWATWDVTSKSGVDEIGTFLAAYRTAIGMPHELPEPPLPAASDGDATPSARTSAMPDAKANGKRGSNTVASRTSEAGKPGSSKRAAAKAGPVKTGPIKTGPIKTGPVKAGPAKAGPVKSGPVKSGSDKNGSGKSGSAKAGSAKAGSGKPGSSSHAAQANGSASPSTGHKTVPNGTRRARGA